MNVLAGLAGAAMGVWSWGKGLLTSEFSVWQTLLGLVGVVIGSVALYYGFRFGKKATVATAKGGWSVASFTGRGIGSVFSGLFGLVTSTRTLQPAFGTVLALAGLAGLGYGFGEYRNPSDTVDLAAIKAAKEICTSTVETKNADNSVVISQQVDSTLFNSLVSDLKSARTAGDINAQKVPRSMALATLLGGFGALAAGVICTSRGLHYNNQINNLLKDNPHLRA
jgi:hypothetical protein